jgi:thiol:disulfide interchange protein DsbD
MNNKIITSIGILIVLLGMSRAQAIEFDEVRNFEDVFVISGTAPARDRVEISWKIADDYYLYNNKFLRFTSATDGVVIGEPQIPRGEIGFDDLLGEEVEKFHGELTVTLPLVSVAPGVRAVQLKVRSQGCLENVLCYPPTEQLLVVSLPGETQTAKPVAAPSTNVFSGLGQNEPLMAMADEPALEPEKAFVYESIGLNADTALVRISPQPGYYLYRDKFAFRVAGDSGFVIRAVELPDGVIKDDPEFGPVEVYFDQIEVPVRFNRPAGEARDIELEADFQGCRDGDICYPPMSRSIVF